MLKTTTAPGECSSSRGPSSPWRRTWWSIPPRTIRRFEKVLELGARWKPDKVIVLTSSVDTVEKHIRLRKRPHEDAENMVRRFRLIDAEFRRLAPRYPNTVLVNRDGMEFHTRRGLLDVIALAGLPAFPEIAYEPPESR